MAVEEKTASLTHLGPDGSARMVDVSEKSVTTRTAVAKGLITMNSAASSAVKLGTSAKGDVLQIARIAGIQGAKQTSSLIPLCHFLPLEKVHIQFAWIADDCLECTAEVKTTAKTGVEMEALTAVTTALLTVYDMLKAVDRTMRISEIALWHKDGGASGTYRRESET